MCSVRSDSLWPLWTVAHQTPLSMGFSRPEYWGALPFPSPGDLPEPGIEPRSPTLQVDFFFSMPNYHLLIGIFLLSTNGLNSGTGVTIPFIGPAALQENWATQEKKKNTSLCEWIWVDFYCKNTFQPYYKRILINICKIEENLVLAQVAITNYHRWDGLINKPLRLPWWLRW